MLWWVYRLCTQKIILASPRAFNFRACAAKFSILHLAFSILNSALIKHLALKKQAGVAVAKEAEVVLKGIVIDSAPIVAAHKCRH